MKIFAVAYNYAEYNKTAGSPLYLGEEPVIFTKADSSLLKGGRPMFLPDTLGRIDYEAELVVRICRLGKGIPQRFAHRYYDAVTCGVDFTARDLQQQLRKQSLPWDVCKSFDGAAAIGEWVPMEDLSAIQDIRFGLITSETITTWNYLGNIAFAFIPIVITIMVLIIGALVFRKKSKFFAEEV